MIVPLCRSKDRSASSGSATAVLPAARWNTVPKQRTACSASASKSVCEAIDDEEIFEEIWE
jgi:hypothetical protein